MRGLLAFVVVAGLIAAAVFLADHPGRVDIVWRGFEIETSVGILLAAVIAAAAVVVAILRLLMFVIRGPKALLRRRRERRREAGYRALTQGLVAVAAGEPHEAQRHARKADLLLADPPLTLLLSAQAAQLEGDESAAKRFFTAMLDRPETEFLGLRGLLNQALRAGDLAAARRFAERARVLRPNTPWVVETVFDLEARDGRWEAARDTLKTAERRGLLPAERVRHHRGVILYELALAARQRGERQQAAKLAAAAEALVPDLAAPAAARARWLLEEGRTAAAAKAVERAWRSAPQPELAEVWGMIHAALPPLARVKSCERLAAANPAARASHVAVAEAALTAHLWGEARRHLDEALAAAAPPHPDPPLFTGGTPPGPAARRNGAPPSGPTRRLCLLWARLAEAESEPARMREWLDRAVAALPDPRYVCANCGGESFAWRPLCPCCGSFDTLAWRTPAR
ncbi:MAG TPA: heme biosynthesis HemY N-terminal domain-containing protein, partial [Stellaceae bacterium]|nr:heme biosynthesis HemY N-terminal domain-containing protein [Stellaceae bacterium]